MLVSIHRQTSNRGPNPEPPAPTSLPQLPPEMVAVARDPNRRARIAVNHPHFPAFQPHIDIQPLLDILIVLIHHHPKRARRATQLRPLPIVQPDAVDDGPRRDHMQRQTIPPPRRLARNHARIRRPAQRIQQLLRHPLPKALHHLARPHPLRRNDIAQFPRLVPFQ